jgi:pimeloyl-ACP methyl ester carboxylesterase
MDSKTLALLSAAVYSRLPTNQVSPPIGWRFAVSAGTPLYVKDIPTTGFSSGAFEGPDGEIVISFTGTNDPPPFGLDWREGNYRAGLGYYSPQVRGAIEFMSDVMAAYPGRQITLTGHSLGAGLASLMAVYFDLPAVVFNAAPFEASAYPSTPSALLASPVNRYFNDYVAYQSLKGRTVDQKFSAYNDAITPFGLFTSIFSEREQRVAAVSLSGEILEGLRLLFPTIVGNDRTVVDVSASTLWSRAIVDVLDRSTLHSIDLLSLILGSSKFGAAAQQVPEFLRAATGTFSAPDLRTTPTPDLIAQLVRDEFGRTDGAGVVTAAPNGNATKFAPAA